MEIKINPVSRYILVKEQEERERGGFLIPETYKDELQKGYVVRVGEEVTNIKEGDVVLYAKAKGHVIEGLKIILVDELLATIEENVKENVSARAAAV